MSIFYFAKDEDEVKSLIQEGKLGVKDYYSLEKSKSKFVYRIESIEGETHKATPLKIS